MRQQPNNKRLALILAGFAAGMVGLSFAAVPLYEIFCQVTGYGGTTQIAEAGADDTLERTIKVRFVANVDKEMPWNFEPSQLSQEITVGEPALAKYHAFNPANYEVVGTAVFNVTPFKAGPYFNKVECFCFTRQVLAAGEEAEFPVTYFVDPAIADDPNLDDVKEIVLSYTFYVAPSEDSAAEGRTAQTGQDDISNQPGDGARQ